MAKLKVDLKYLRQKIMMSGNVKKKVSWHTSGEQYLSAHILPRCMSEGKALLFCEIDFERFTEDDIIALIDDKLPELERSLAARNKLISPFIEGEAATVQMKKFF